MTERESDRESDRERERVTERERESGRSHLPEMSSLPSARQPEIWTSLFSEKAFIHFSMVSLARLASSGYWPGSVGGTERVRLREKERERG